MWTEAQQYCLGAMGFDVLQNTAETVSVILVIPKPEADLSSEELVLLDQLKFYLKISDAACCFIENSELRLGDKRCSSQDVIEKYKPKFMIGLGQRSLAQYTDQTHVVCIETAALEAMLNDPDNKKRVFIDVRPITVQKALS